MFSAIRTSLSRSFTSAAPQASGSSSKTGLYVLTAAGIAGLGYYYYSSNASSKPELKTFLTPEAFKSVKVLSTEDVNYNTKIIKFQLPENHTLGMPVASCLSVATADESNPLSRPYTPISQDTDVGFFTLMVKKYAKGPMSTYLHSLKPGDSIRIQGPWSSLKYEPNMKKEIGMIAGGTGLTPMLQVIDKILSNPNDKTQVKLLFANVKEADILLKDRLEELAKKHSNFQVFYTLDKPAKEWKGFQGHVNEDMIKKTMPLNANDSMILVCGPDGFLTHIAGAKNPDRSQGELGGLLKKMGLHAEQVYKF